VLPFRAIQQNQLNEILGSEWRRPHCEARRPWASSCVRSTAAVAKYVDADPIAAGRELRADAVLEAACSGSDIAFVYGRGSSAPADGRPL